MGPDKVPGKGYIYLMSIVSLSRVETKHQSQVCFGYGL